MSDAPQVALNARAAVRLQIGGVERYARELIARLRTLRPDRYVTVSPRPRLAHRMGHVWEQVALPSLSSGCALIYSPANVAPVCSDRNVVVIHDVAALTHPDAYSAAYLAYHSRVLRAVARGARLVITVSEFSRGEIADHLGIDPDGITVIAPGVGREFTRTTIDGRNAARRPFGLDSPYVLTVGTASARKNHAALEPVARALTERGIELVHAGSDRAYLRGGELTIRRLGYVAEADLPALYAGALAFTMPSLHEGFGMPCVEAMACGTPVVAAAAGAIPETCAGAALLVDPANARDLTDAVLTAATDDGERARLIRAGLARARDFSWDRSAAATDAALATLADRCQSGHSTHWVR